MEQWSGISFMKFSLFWVSILISMLLVTVFSFPGAGLLVSPEITSMERNSVSHLAKPEWDWTGP